MKKLLKSLFSICLIAVLCLSVNCKPEESKKESVEEPLFTVVNGYVTGLTPKGSNARNLVIPAEIDGEEIKGIGSGAFEYGGFQSVVIPDSVTFISARAFANCQFLSAVTFSNKLEQIDDEAFMDCESLKEISLPLSLKCIDENAFLDCLNLQTIKFAGTYYSWTAIDHHHDWTLNENLKKLICIDKEISFGGGSEGELPVISD